MLSNELAHVLLMKAVGVAFAAAGLIFLSMSGIANVLSVLERCWCHDQIYVRGNGSTQKDFFLFLNISYQVWCLARCCAKSRGEHHLLHERTLESK